MSWCQWHKIEHSDDGRSKPGMGMHVIWRRHDGLTGEGYWTQSITGEPVVRLARMQHVPRVSAMSLLDFTHWTEFPGEPDE